MRQFGNSLPAIDPIKLVSNARGGLRMLALHCELGMLRGGGENFTRNLICVLAKRGYRIDASFVARSDSSFLIPMPEGITPLPIPCGWALNPGQSFLSSICDRLPRNSEFRQQWNRVQDSISWRTTRWQTRKFQRKVEKAFSRRWHQYDFVFVNRNIGLACSAAAHRPTLLWLPGPVHEYLAPMLRSIPVVAADGDAFRRLSLFLGDHATEISIGLDVHSFRPGSSKMRSSLGWGADDCVIGYVGRLTRLKGVDLLAHAFSNISSRIPHARLLMIGHGEEESNLRRILSSQLSMNTARLIGGVEHECLPDWYRALNILVLPSRYENFSNAILEALGCGIPVLASAVGGNQFVADIGGGWLFEPDSTQSLISSLLQILPDRDGMQKRGTIGSRYVRDRYSWEATADRMEYILATRLQLKSDP